MCHRRPSVHVAPCVGNRSGRTRVGASDLVIGEGQHSVLACIRSVPAEERRDQGEHLLRSLRHADVGDPGEYGQLRVRQESEQFDDVGQR